MDKLVIAGKQFTSRLLIGTGKFSSSKAMAQAIEAAGDHEKRHVEVDLEANGRAEGIHVEEAHRVRERVLDQHALGIPGDHLLGRSSLVGQKDGRLVVAEVTDVDLTVGAAEQSHAPLEDSRRSGWPGHLSGR